MLMKRFSNLFSYKPHTNGDTIVEVLIAIAVAAFAIGTSYAIANRSLQHAISARERNAAINLMEDQISELKIRYAADQGAFNNENDPTKGFVVNSSDNVVGTKFHFCLQDKVKGKDDPLWGRLNLSNNFTNDSQPDILTVGGSPGYNTNCHRKYGGTDYYLDVSALITSSSVSLNNKTIYRIIVRWPDIGTGNTNSSTAYYRF